MWVEGVGNSNLVMDINFEDCYWYYWILGNLGIFCWMVGLKLR